STSTCPAARPGPRPCWRASSCCRSGSSTRTWRRAGEVTPLSSADSGGTEPQAEDQQPAEGTEAAEPEAPAVDEVRQPLLDSLKAELGDSILGAEIAGGDIWVRVERSAWVDAARVAKTKLGMEQFC